MRKSALKLVSGRGSSHRRPLPVYTQEHGRCRLLADTLNGRYAGRQQTQCCHIDKEVSTRAEVMVDTPCCFIGNLCNPTNRCNVRIDIGEACHPRCPRARWIGRDRFSVDQHTIDVCRRPQRNHRDQVIDHVLGAEASYARKLGVTHRQPARDDAPAIAALRDDIAAALSVPVDSTPLLPAGWPPLSWLRSSSGVTAASDRGAG